MASLKTISLPHGTIPTQMFGNVNLQNAVMYINENFAAVKDGMNDAVSATNDALNEKADSGHDHDDSYAALEHTHGIDAVTGLSAALDGKAALNHEHSQYLSSLPAHYHDVSGIQGLGEQLQAKAEKTHAHTIAQVESLSTELGVKASTAYVDQQVNSVGSTIKTIADQEIVDYGASKEGSGGSASADVPVNTEIAPFDETVAQKNARVGTTNRWARADHKHVFETETSDLTKLKCDGDGDEGAASFGTETNVPRIDHSHPLNVDPSVSFLPSDVVKSSGSASAGLSKYYAQADHVHKMPALEESDITDLETDLSAIEGEVDDHETRISALEGGSGGGTVKSVDNQQPDANGNVSLANDTTLVQRTMMGQPNGVQDHSDVLDAVAGGGHYDTEDGAHEITGGAHYVSSSPSKAQILGVLANSTSVTMRSSIGTDMVTYDGSNTIDNIITTAGMIDGTTHVSVGSASGKFVKTGTNGVLAASADRVASFANATTAGRIVATDGIDGELAEITPYSANPYSVDVVTGVTWSGTQINITGKTLTFKHGVLTNVANKQYSSITTVTYNP